MNILYIMSSYNIYGGTPKKTLDLLKYSKENCSLYAYNDAFKEFKSQFEDTGASVYEGAYGRNIFLHVKALLKIVDRDKIEVVQTQFFMGEFLGYMIKLFRPHIKILVAFVGPFQPKGIKKHITEIMYKKMDAFVYISEYVRKEKTAQFPILLNKHGRIIYNGTEARPIIGSECPELKRPSLVGVAALIDWKNADVLINAMNLLVNRENRSLYLYLAGEGAERKSLQLKIKECSLEENVILLGNQKNIGALLDQADIYVHPAFAEGFGIAVAEAMMAEKPIVAADAGALPELIEHESSGLIVNPYDAEAWAAAILMLLDKSTIAEEMAKTARNKAEKCFSIKKYVENYQDFYESLI
ncbi:MAG: glycosyltransferase family 4 protein [Pseudomonadales bacterium]|nr:glycosyltransferase family 4 protein [Pseudomonadales bacterium]